MKTFDFLEPTSLDEVFTLTNRFGDDAHLLAGGTASMLLMRQGLLQPDHLVSLRKLPDLSSIRSLPDGGLEIGALATHRAVEVSEDARAFCPALVETFSRVATIRIRNQGTVGGNLAHADPAQDPPPMLLALDASVVVRSGDGERTVNLNDGFFVDYFETSLRPGEVITHVRIPPLAPGTRAAYTKFLPRSQDDYACVAVAAALRLHDDGSIADLRVALGAAGVTPMRAFPVEDALRGTVPTPAQVKEVAALAMDVVDPLDDARGSAGYKRQMARVWVERTVLRLLN